ncbi:hypothetical protein AAFF_G00044830, partial [Aldrovandia affinis]
IANHSGYVQVDWKKVEKDVNKAKKHLKKKANKAAPEINSFIEEVWKESPCFGGKETHPPPSHWSRGSGFPATCSGYLFQRVGKIAATAVGGGFLLLQIANHSGYVQVDWKKVEKDVNKAKKHLKKKANKAAPEINSFIEE